MAMTWKRRRAKELRTEKGVGIGEGDGGGGGEDAGVGIKFTTGDNLILYNETVVDCVPRPSDVSNIHSAVVEKRDACDVCQPNTVRSKSYTRHYWSFLPTLH